MVDANYCNICLIIMYIFQKSDHPPVAPKPDLPKIEKPKTKELDGYVGFANLPNQVYRKAVKRGFEFTLMVVGECFVKKKLILSVKVKFLLNNNDSCKTIDTALLFLCALLCRFARRSLAKDYPMFFDPGFFSRFTIICVIICLQVKRD